MALTYERTGDTSPDLQAYRVLEDGREIGRFYRETGVDKFLVDASLEERFMHNY